ncbi:MAG: 5-(carboxyamino)imidazole ribonucleotide synthase [Rhizobiales bacterium]|nr:5-(carboxyamino)imidazole ribonucleotide synthase [Hyphomicrobiales bacterium]
MAQAADRRRWRAAGRGRGVSPATVLQPGATIGILGGGQLGRMLALAAARLGLHCHVYAADADSPAFDVVQKWICAPYDDRERLAAFADAVDLITYEFENVPAETANFLAARRIVLPDPAVLARTQDRLIEKTFIADLAIATAPFAAVGSLSELAAAVDAIGLPAVLKTRRLGYDGKGQAMIAAGGDPLRAWEALGRAPTILEGFVPFEREISVIVARSRDGQLQSFDVAENEHRDHILKVSRVPAAITPDVAAQADDIAARIAKAFGFVGVLAVEMFVVHDGSGTSVLVNEIAPRVHNSGHWTLDGCTVSQFEQHIRAVAGWPLAVPVRWADVEMINLIGDEVNDYARWLGVTGAAVHLYGKSEARPGRKMGHVTRMFHRRR